MYYVIVRLENGQKSFCYGMVSYNLETLFWTAFLIQVPSSLRVPQRERILSYKNSSLRYGKSLLPHYVSSLECYDFYYARAYTCTA